MTRQKRQFMRQGVSDLPTRTAVKAYVGAPGEPIFDFSTLRMQDGVTPGGIPLLSPANDLGLTDAEKAQARLNIGVVDPAQAPISTPQQAALDAIVGGADAAHGSLAKLGVLVDAATAGVAQNNTSISGKLDKTGDGSLLSGVVKPADLSVKLDKTGDGSLLSGVAKPADISGKLDIVDQSSVAGNASKFFSGNYFGNPATGKLAKVNRIFVGVATGSGGERPATTPIWTQTYFSNIVDDSQFVSVSALGSLGVTGVSRTSDYRTWTGGAAGGAQGVSGFGLNDDPGGGVAAGLYGEVIHTPTATGITEAAEVTISNGGPTVDVTPYGGIIGGSTIGLNITAGFRSGYTNNAAAALTIGSVTGAARFKRGIVALASGLDPSIGRGGAGVAIELGTGMSIRGLDASNAVKGELYFGPNGLVIGPNRIEGAWASYTPTVTTSGGTAISGVTTDCATIRIGRTVHFRCKVTLPASGFGDGSLSIGLPSYARSSAVWMGRASGVSGPVQAVLSMFNNSVSILSITDTNIGAASRSIEFSGSYEANSD